MAQLHCIVVTPEETALDQKAESVVLPLYDGEIGILPNHIPLVAQLVDDAMVRVEREGEDDLRIAVDGGFLSVTEQGVTVLAESAEFDSEIDEAAAQRDAESDDPATAAKGRARLRALGQID